jgi:hypothetical protein
MAKPYGLGEAGRPQVRVAAQLYMCLFVHYQPDHKQTDTPIFATSETLSSRLTMPRTRRSNYYEPLLEDRSLVQVSAPA